MIEPTEEARIKQLLAEGNLTTEEAQRLRTSLDNQREREAAFRQAVVSVRERRRVWLLLSFIITFFLLGAGTQWLPSSFAGDIAAPIVTAEKPTSAQAEGRLINLSRSLSVCPNPAFPQ